MIFSNEKVSTMLTHLTWSHYLLLLPLKEYDKIIYYLEICRIQNLDVRSFGERIKKNEYERLPEETKIKLTTETEMKAQDLFKEPIIIKNSKNYENISEKLLQRLILEDITSFLNELGNGFTFVGNEYKIKIGRTYNYIDLLLFNYEYNCFVVVELKVTELKKEHIGQIEVYMNYIDRNLRKITQDKTIGIIICRKNNKYVIEYCSDKRIVAKQYSIT